MSNFSLLNEYNLLNVANNLYGMSIEQLSNKLSVSCPINLKKNKGFIGRLLELCFGVKTSYQTQQDFPHLGIELKTIIINKENFPLENTSICLVPLVCNTGLTWNTSYFFHKIQKILWIPIQTGNNITLAQAKIKKPFLWSPSAFEENILKNDWEEFMDLIVMGKIEKITSELGQFIQIRSKAKNKLSKTKAINPSGKFMLTIPRCFYFRKIFTRHLIQMYMKTI